MVFTNARVITAAVLALGALGAGGTLPGDLPQAAKKPTGNVEAVAVPVIGDPLGAVQDPADGKNPSTPCLAEKERRHQAILKKLNAPEHMEQGLEKMTFDEAKKYFEISPVSEHPKTNQKTFSVFD